MTSTPPPPPDTTPPSPRERPRLRRDVLTVLISLALFAAIAIDVTHTGPLARLDPRISHYLHDHPIPALAAILLLLTHLGAWPLLLVFTAITAYFLYKQRRPADLLHLLLAVPGGLLLNIVLKHLFTRPRPELVNAPLELTTHSFPSGHTAGAFAFYTLLALLILRTPRRMHHRVGIATAAVSIVVVVAFSRIYLGVHYLTDTLAACLTSLAWLATTGALARLIFHRTSRRAQSPT